MTKHCIRDIEVLRAGAIIFTLIEHSGILFDSVLAPDRLFQLWSGVDLFFVISGFVIARGLFNQRAAYADIPSFTKAMVAFWIRRVWRLWPTLWLWMAIALLFSVIFKREEWGNLIGSLSSIVGIVSFPENLHHICFIRSDMICSPLAFAPYWSISLEEQFYLLFPLLLIFVPKKNFPLALAFGILSQLFLPRAAGHLLWLIRSDALLLGVSIALSLESLKIRPLFEPIFLKERPSLTYGCTAILFFLLATISCGQIVPFTTGMLALIASLLVWIASFDKNYILPENALKKILVWIGSRSYAIYITHITIILIVKAVIRTFLPYIHDTYLRVASWSFYIVGVAAVAEFNYRLVETPLRHRGRRISDDYINKQFLPEHTEEGII